MYHSNLVLREKKAEEEEDREQHLGGAQGRRLEELEGSRGRLSRGRRAQLKRIQGFPTERRGQNLAVTVLYVPYSVDREQHMGGVQGQLLT